MVPNDTLINAVRSLGYKFKKQTDRVDLYKKKGGTQRVAIRRNSAHDPDYARSILKQAGMSLEAIERFIADVGCVSR